jgi:hypothetical protein
MLEAQNAGFVGGAGNPALASLFPEAFGSGFTQFEQNTPLMGLTGMAARRAGLRSPEYRAPQGTTRNFRQRVPGGFQLTADPSSSRPGADFGGGPGTVGGFDAEAESHDAVGNAIGNSVAADLGGTGLAAGLGMGALGASMGLGLGDALGIALGSGTMAALSPIGIALGLNNALGMSMDANIAGNALSGVQGLSSDSVTAGQLGALGATTGGLLGHGISGLMGALGMDATGTMGDALGEGIAAAMDSGVGAVGPIGAALDSGALGVPGGSAGMSAAAGLTGPDSGTAGNTGLSSMGIGSTSLGALDAAATAANMGGISVGAPVGSDLGQAQAGMDAADSVGGGGGGGKG